MNSASLVHISKVSWSKLSKALCKFACIPVGGSFVILIDASKMLWGMMCPAGVGAGSAVRNNLKREEMKNYLELQEAFVNFLAAYFDSWDKINFYL